MHLTNEFKAKLAPYELVLSAPTLKAWSILPMRQDILRITDLERSFVIKYARN